MPDSSAWELISRLRDWMDQNRKDNPLFKPSLTMRIARFFETTAQISPDPSPSFQAAPQSIGLHRKQQIPVPKIEWGGKYRKDEWYVRLNECCLIRLSFVMHFHHKSGNLSGRANLDCVCFQSTVNFELHLLGWKAFQVLSVSILREILGQTVQQFFDSMTAVVMVLLVEPGTRRRTNVSAASTLSNASSQPRGTANFQ
jgi:hypothetical protein